MPRASDWQAWRSIRQFEFLVTSHLTVMLMVQGPHSEPLAYRMALKSRVTPRAVRSATPVPPRFLGFGRRQSPRSAPLTGGVGSGLTAAASARVVLQVVVLNVIALSLLSLPVPAPNAASWPLPVVEELRPPWSLLNPCRNVHCWLWPPRSTSFQLVFLKQCLLFVFETWRKNDDSLNNQ